MYTEHRRTSLKKLIDKFIVARDAENLSPLTLKFYRTKLDGFERYCDENGVLSIEDIDKNLIREYLLGLRDDHEPGGVHAFYRSIRAFLNWYNNEFEPEDWRNPIKKVHAPKVPDKILDPATESQVRALLAVCDNSYFGIRDKAIIKLLDNTGLRASELIMLDLEDIDLSLSTLYVQHGKGGYPRAVDFDHDTKRALRNYLRVRPACDTNAVWISKTHEPLTYDGLRSMIADRSKAAGIEHPKLHAFRRKHALDLHREGESRLTIQRRLGHRDDSTLKRYIKLSREDMRVAARREKNHSRNRRLNW